MSGSTISEDVRSAFIGAATWHGSLDEAEALLAKYPGLAKSSIHVAAVLGDAEAVRHFINADAANATVLTAPYNCNALVCLGLSKYLRLGKRSEDGFLRAATALMDTGADPNSGFWTTGKFPEFETALYGAAGVAHNTGLTKLLLDRGADPNDGEAVYHSPETDDNDAMKLLVETGKVTSENLTMMLIRKHDWHDPEGVKYLLEYGADPNGERSRGWYPLHHALARSNSIRIITLLMDHGADPCIVNDGLTAVARAAHEGRGDVLKLFAERGFSIALQGVDQLIAACAMCDSLRVNTILSEKPQLRAELIALGPELLMKFTGAANTAGILLLLDTGIAVNTPTMGDGYFGIPRNSPAIHIAAWLGHPEMVKLLLKKGAIVDAPDENGQTPLMLAVRACVDSYWTYKRSPDSVKALLEAGASADKVPFPCGYMEVDELLEKYRK